MGKRICIFTNHFYPEDFKANDVAFELAKNDFDVSVVTAVPDYPKGKFFDGYGIFKKSREMVNGCKVYRLPIIPRGRGGAVRLVLNYASYYLCARIFTFFHKFFCKYDAVFVHLTSPFFIGKCAVALKRRQKIPLVFWVLDLWPESLTAAAGIQSPLIINSQRRMVANVYKNCDKILIGSKGFEKSILEKGDFKDKLVYFPNWAENVASAEISDEVKNPSPFCDFTEDDFVLLFAGNIGEAQNIGCILDAAVNLKNETRIKFVFLGDGRARERLVRRAEDESLLERTVFFPGRFPIETMPHFMRKAAVLMVSLKNDEIFNLTVPQKVQFYMAQGKPILALLNGDGADLVSEAQCGFAVEAGNCAAFADAVLKLSALSKADLESMGQNGKNFYEKNFRKDLRIRQLLDLLSRI